MTSEVRTTVDEKLVNQMTEQPKINEPVIDEVKKDESKTEETNINNEPDYDLSLDKPKVEDKEVPQSDRETDEFGNEVVKKKVYTEEEVNELIHERVNRIKKNEAVKQQQVQPNQPNETNEENWEASLEGFVENTVKKLSMKEQQRVQEEREKSMQAEFEDKMMQGMGKYKDFKDVVGKMPITDTMLLATRQMKDPAAFIYAASKTNSKELQRIAQIPDPYYQAAEIGRLEERMRKVRSGTASPRPVSEVKGDIENRSNVRGNVDDLIRKDALKKFSTRRY